MAHAKAPEVLSSSKIEALSGKIVTDPKIVLSTANELRKSFASGATTDLLAAAQLDWLRSAALAATNDPAASERIASSALRTVERILPNSVLMGRLLLVHGQSAAALGQGQNALADYHRAYRIFGSIADQRDQAVALLHISASYAEAGDYENALKYTLQALETFSSDQMLQLAALNNAGDALNHLNRYGEGESEFKRALTIAGSLGSRPLQVRILRNIAEAQIGQGRYDEASSTVEQALVLSTGGPASDWRSDLYGTAASIALHRNQIDLAATLIRRTFRGLPDADTALSMQPFHRIAYEIYRRRGEVELALHHLEVFRELDDRSRMLAASASSKLLAARFDFANQDLKIARLRAERAEREGVLAQTRVRYHTILTSGLLAGAAVIVTLLTIGFVSIRRSRNQVRAANAELQVTNADLAKALAAKTEFLATTSHEIRTPLNGILGMTQVLLANRRMEEDLRTRVELIHGAGEAMRVLVDDILDMAKMETGELRIYPADMDLQKLLRDAGTIWAGQAETKGISVAVELDDCPVGIVADEVRVRQIVFNLMSNAIKFTDRGGVRLVARAETREEGEVLSIAIADSGIGIPADQLALIFEAFRQVDGGVTRRHGGTGLGLAICQNLARVMGGDVAVTSTPGAGSVFTLELPLVRAALPAPKSAPPLSAAGPASLSEAALLLIEPNPLAQGILRALLAPHVRALHIVGDVAAASGPITAGGIGHVLADAAAFALDPTTAAGFRGRVGAARLTLLWPAPDADLLATFSAAEIDQVLAKPIAAPDLLARLRMLYDAPAIDRDLAA